MTLPLSLRLAWRELRGGLKGLRLFLACVALGVAVIAGVGSLRASVEEGLKADARILLGGDLHVSLTHRPASPEQEHGLQTFGTLSTSAEMRAMARGQDRRVLIELKAVDGAYPLYGAVALEPAKPLNEVLARTGGVWGAAAEPALLSRLGLKLGDRVAVGDATYELRAIVAHEPDRTTNILTLGLRLLVDYDSLAETGLIQPGSLVQYHYRLRLPPARDPGEVTSILRERFPDSGWRIRGLGDAAPGVQRFLDRIAMFLTLVGLSALLVGGVGVANAVRAYVEARTQTIAALKCLGASGGLIEAVYRWQVLALGLIGVAIGLVIGGLIPLIVAPLVADQLPVAARIGLYPGPLGLAAAFGLLTALAFSLWPVARAREIAPAALFRDLVAPTRRWPRAGAVAATVATLAALAGLAIATAADPRLAAGFCAGAIIAFALFRGAAWGLARLAAALPRPRQPALRLALGNLHRPGSPTPSVVLAMGLGLTLLVVVTLVQGNLARQIEEQLPEVAPSFFFLDLQPDQVAPFTQLVSAIPGVERIEQVPALRGRISQINGVAVEQATIGPEARWATGSDRGLTYAATPPPGTRVVAGSWWPPDYRGPPLISFDAGIARGMGLGVGDTLTVNVLGRDVTARIANLRAIDWSSLGINFTIVFAPGTLEAAPHTHIATVRATPEAEEAVERAVGNRFLNVSTIRVREALATVEGVLDNITSAARLMAGVTLLAGTLVVAGAVLASQRRRIYDSVVLKVLGARRRHLVAALALEFGLIGAATAALAGVLGTIGAWVLMATYMRVAFVPLPGSVAAVAAGSVAAIVVLGLVGTWRALGQRPGPLLRHA